MRDAEEDPKISRRGRSSLGRGMAVEPQGCQARKVEDQLGAGVVLRSALMTHSGVGNAQVSRYFKSVLSTNSPSRSESK